MAAVLAAADADLGAHSLSTEGQRTAEPLIVVFTPSGVSVAVDAAAHAFLGDDVQHASERLAAVDR